MGRRRWGFAAPLVTTFACHHAAPAPAAPDDEAWRLPPLETPADAPAGDRFADPKTWHVPFGPLGRLARGIDCPEGWSCNPPHPSMNGSAETVAPTALGPDAGGGTRVRMRIVDTRMTTAWRAHFDDGTACRIVEVGVAELDCVTPRAPRTLIDDRTGNARALVLERPDPDAPRDPADPRIPQVVRVVNAMISGDSVVLELAGGTATGITREARLELLVGATDRLMANGGCAVVRLDKTRTLCLVKLTLDQVTSNPRVRVSYSPVPT